MSDDSDSVVIPPLAVEFYTNPNLQPYDLYRHPSDRTIAADLDYTYEFHETEMLNKGRDTVVYRGKLLRNDDWCRWAVVKLGWHDSHPRVERALLREYELYTGPLAKLQDDIVPVCYGLFQGHTDHGTVTCLLMDYAGEPISKSDKEIDPDLRLDLVEAIVRLHDEGGIVHNDLSEDNMLLTEDEQWRLIDFEHAREHKCGRTMNVEEGDPCPDEVDFGCSEIWSIASESGVWRPGYIRFFNWWIKESKIQSEADLYNFARSTHPRLVLTDTELKTAVDNIMKALRAYRSSPEGKRPREYWFYEGESEVNPSSTTPVFPRLDGWL